MKFVICNALKANGTLCQALAVTGGKRCRHHGGYSTGPTTPMGKLRCTITLLAHKANGAPIGHRKTNKTKLRRIAAAKRLKAWREREPIRWKRAVRWENRKRIKLGLPLIDVEQLDKSSTPDEGESR